MNTNERNHRMWGNRGHLLPGLAVAEKLLSRGHRVRLLVSEKTVDLVALGALTSAYSRSSGALTVTPLSAIGYTGLKRLMPFCYHLAQATNTCAAEYAAFEPDVVLGMGGFTSAPAVLAARWRGVPSLIHESNDVPGKANAWIGRFANRVALGLGECAAHFGKRRTTSEIAARDAFVVVQDLFLTETAQAADVVLPAASAYEKAGTFTNVCGEVQRLKEAISVVGTKPDLTIIGFIAREMGVASEMGPWDPRQVFDEIRETVRGYDVSPAVIAAGGAAQTMPPGGLHPYAPYPELVRSEHNGLFSSGTLGRYCAIPHAVLESRLERRG